MNATMYIFLNKGLNMSAGKASAQAAHAAVEAYRITPDSLRDPWLKSGYTKLVMEARDENHLRNIRDYLDEKGFAHHSIIDEGRTEVDAHSFTALGVPVVDRDDPLVQFVFGGFKLYKDPKPAVKRKRKRFRFLKGR